MSITSVSSGSNYYSPNIQTSQSSIANAFKQRKQDFATLAGALNSGDLSGAQQAFASLQQDIQAIAQGRGAQGADGDGDNDGGQATASTSATPSGSGNPIDQRTPDMTALSNALGSGDLNAAQQAFASLQQDLQAMGQARHHHGHQGNAGTATASAGTSPSGGIDTSA